MTFLDLAKKRRSVRKYSHRPIEDEKLQLVLEVGRIAPSAANFQPRYFIVVRDKEKKERIAGSYSKFNFNNSKDVPAFIVICGDHQKSWHRKLDGKDYCDLDIAIAVDHMTLQAAELGLGTCWIGDFDPQACRKVLDIPDHIEPIAILHIGYSIGESQYESELSKEHSSFGNNQDGTKKRKSFEEIVFWNKFGN
ncbi:FMN reductase [NAD(P)H] [Peptococcaceae bacterium CEB3]|nr:FMN reductase [NAD(P)H] [Peptococcaceae bacterium CEB3]